MRLVLVFAVAVAVAACWRGGDPAVPATTPVASPPPPAPATCGAAAERFAKLVAKRAVGHSPEVRAAIAVRCAEDLWSKQIMGCVANAADGPALEHCKGLAAPEQIHAVERTLTAIEEQIPVECVEYREAVHEVMSCDRMPQATRDAISQGFDLAAPTWANADERHDAAESCRTIADALRQIRGAMGCSDPVP